MSEPNSEPNESATSSREQDASSSSMDAIRRLPETIHTQNVLKIRRWDDEKATCVFDQRYEQDFIAQCEDENVRVERPTVEIDGDVDLTVWTTVDEICRIWKKVRPNGECHVTGPPEPNGTAPQEPPE